MEKLFFRATLMTAVVAFFSSSVFAGSHNEAIREAMKDPKKMEAFMADRLDHTTGLEGQEAKLGESVAELVAQMNGKLDLSKSSNEEFGRNSLTAVKTMNHNASYQHEYNDALVKLHLTAVSFAKETGMYDKLVENDVKTTEYMMKRIGATHLETQDSL